MRQTGCRLFGSPWAQSLWPPRNRMRETFTSGSVGGAPGNRCIYPEMCFLHVFISIRDRSSKKFKEVFAAVSEKLWNCYRADTKSSFSQRVRRLCEWSRKAEIPVFIVDKLEKLRNNLPSFSEAYDFPGALRTSNMLDRLMRRMDRRLFGAQYFHGTLISANLNMRAWTLIHNFAPFNPQTIRLNKGLRSPAEKLNGFRYHSNWLQNLLISASLGGYRQGPPNPL